MAREGFYNNLREGRRRVEDFRLGFSYGNTRETLLGQTRTVRNKGSCCYSNIPKSKRNDPREVLEGGV